MSMELILNKKGTRMCLPHVSSVFRKISPKTFELHYVCSILVLKAAVCERFLSLCKIIVLYLLINVFHSYQINTT